MSREIKKDIGPCTKCGKLVELTRYKGKAVCLPCWFELTDGLIYRASKQDEELKDG